MLYYVSEGIDVNKTSESKECNICLYWYILDICFERLTIPVVVESLFLLSSILVIS